MGNRNYIYGIWSEGHPNGINVIRIGDNIVMCEYRNGIIINNLLIISEQHNMAAVINLQGSQDNNGGIIHKGELFCKEHLDDYISLCKFTYEVPDSYLTLVKYISEHLTTQFTKIRLIHNSKYRFGFDNGLAILFDDEYNISSCGYHSKNDLK